VIEYLDTAMTLGGVLVGFIFGRRERNQRRPVAYRCDCGHSMSMHHPGDNKKGKTTCMKCDCRQYIGPEPTVWTESTS
jgi:hypothetical protein